MRKGKSSTAIVGHSIVATVVSDEDGNASECGETTKDGDVITVNAAYSSHQQQQEAQSNELKCISNNGQRSDDGDQNQNDANNLNSNSFEQNLSNVENVACK